MSHALGFSSYIMITQKGRTYVPFCRGSCFMMKYSSVSFYNHHILTAAHVAKPHRFKEMFGSPQGFDHIGDRHISYKLFPLDPVDGVNANGAQPIKLHHTVDRFPHVHAVSLRIAEEEKQLTELRTQREEAIARMKTEAEENAREFDPASVPPLFIDSAKPVQVDGMPIDEGEKLIIEGVDAQEDPTNFTDDGLTFTQKTLEAECRAGVTSQAYGTLLLAVTGERKVPPSFAGGPVFRASNGKCVGVVTLPFRTSPLDLDNFNEITKTKDPLLDLCDNGSLINSIGGVGTRGAAFTPIVEFLTALRRTEAI